MSAHELHEDLSLLDRHFRSSQAARLTALELALVSGNEPTHRFRQEIRDLAKADLAMLRGERAKDLGP